MTLTTEKIQLPPRSNQLAERWIPIAVSMALLLFVALGFWTVLPGQAAQPHGSYASLPGDLQARPSATPTVTATAPATSAGAPAATTTATPTAVPETKVKVILYSVGLRTGPGLSFAKVRTLDYGEQLTLLGRLSDNIWIYVKTSDGQEGWITAAMVNLGWTKVAEQPIVTAPTTLQTMVKVSGSLATLRSGPSTNYDKIRSLTYGTPVRLLGRLNDNRWLYVRTSDDQEGWISTSLINLSGTNIYYHPVKTPPPTQIPTPVALPGVKGRWIDLDLSDQMLYAFEDDKVVAAFLVSTGTSLYPTEQGQFHIDVKMRYSDMRGSDYFLPDVPFTMYYYGDYAIHGTYWHHNFGTPMSHGCVNMDTKDAEWLFNWASVGMLVNIHR